MADDEKTTYTSTPNIGKEMRDDEKMSYNGTSDIKKEEAQEDRRRSVPGKVAKHANDADEAMKAFAGHEGEILELDEATSRRLLKKIDFHLMPVRNLSNIVSKSQADHLRSFYASSTA